MLLDFYGNNVGIRAGLWYPSSRGQTRPKPLDFSGKKILSTPSFGGEVKPSVPCRVLRHVKDPQKWRGSRHFRQNFSAISRRPSAAGFPSVASDAGSLLWRKLERSKSLVLLQVGGLTCRWQRHSVKPFCWECSTTVEQAETQLRVVVSIEEEGLYSLIFDFTMHGVISNIRIRN
jgi:hypothetical protein